MTEMIKWIENNKFKSALDESESSNVSGGTSIKNKSMSVALASLMSISSMPISTSASNVKSVDNLYSTSQKSDDGFMDKAKKAVAKFYDAHKKVIIFGGSLSLASLGKISMDKYTDYKYNYDYVVNKYIFGSKDGCQPLSFDEWFTRLGGTQQDIKLYINLKSTYEKGGITPKNEDTINADVPRSFFRIECEWDNNRKQDIEKRLLKIRAYESGKGYTQAHDRFCVLALNKFFSNHAISDYNDNVEAKIYYIYKTLVTASMDSELLSAQYSNFIENLKNNLKLRYFNYYSAPLRLDGDDVILSLFFGQLLTGCGDMCNTEQIIRIWDNIISDNNMFNNGNFDFLKAHTQIFIIIHALWCKIYYEYPRYFSNKNSNSISVAQKAFENYCKDYANGSITNRTFGLD